VTRDYDHLPGYPALPTPVYQSIGCSRLSAEFTHAREYNRIRKQQKREAHRRWLEKPGSPEKARAAQRAWKARK